MLPEFTPRDLSVALDEIAEELLERAGIGAPPVDAFQVAAACRLSVMADELQEGRARFVRLRRQPAGGEAGSIFVRSDPRPERVQWAIAHEIGESQAARVFQQLGVGGAEAAAGAREDVANALAGHLLLPTRWLAPDAADCRWDLLELKRRYRTASHELIARRMLEFEPPAIITVCDKGRVTWRRSPLYARPPRPSPEERRCWHLAHETGEAQRGCWRGLEIRAWPVHEPDWKREILRTELPDSVWDDSVWEDSAWNDSAADGTFLSDDTGDGYAAGAADERMWGDSA